MLKLSGAETPQSCCQVMTVFKMIYIVVVCIIIASVAAQPSPQHCCVPDKWEGHASALGGFYKDSSTVGKFHVVQQQHYDAADKKLAEAFHEVINDEEPGIRGKIIVDFDAQRRYVIDSDNKCTYHALTGSFQRFCIPADAKHIGRHHYGGGTNRLNVDDWNISVGTMNAHLHVTTQGCYPVMETFQGTADGTRVVGGQHWSNITDGIADPKVFEPPSGCTPGEVLGEVNFYDVLNIIFHRKPQQKPVAPKLPRFDRL